MDSPGFQADLVKLLSNELKAIEMGERDALDRFVRRLADDVGDSATVSVLEADGLVNGVAVAHRNPEAQAMLQRNRRVELSRSAILSQVVKTGKPVLLSRTSARDVGSFLSEGSSAYLKRFGMASLVIVPLRVEGKVRGALGLSRVERGKAYDSGHERRLQQLADELAVAMLGGGLIAGEGRSAKAGAAARRGLGPNLANLMRGGEAPRA